MAASDDLWVGLQELKAAAPAYRLAEEYYTDHVAEVFASARVRRAIARTGVDFREPFAAKVVDAVANRLKLAAITSPVEEQAVLLQRVWDNNVMSRETRQLHRSVAKYGDGYLIVLPSHDDSKNPELVTGVDVYFNDPLTVRMIYDPENPREKACAIKRWCEEVGDVQHPQTVHRAELYYDDHIERWTTQAGVSGDSHGDWDHWLPDPIEVDGTLVFAAEGAWSMPHDYGEIPVFHFRNDAPYGIPEHERGYGAQDVINKLLVTHMGTVDYQGFPARYGITDAANTDTSDLDPGDFDDDMFPPDPNSGRTDSGDDSSLKSGPGELMVLRGFKQVGQFDAADPSVFYDPLGWHIKALSVLTDTPMHLFDPTGRDPSGQSVKAQDVPFDDKVEARKEDVGATHRETFAFVLHLLAVEDPQVDVRWAPPGTVDDKATWETAEIKNRLGVPVSQLQMEANYTQDQVDAWASDPGDDSGELTRYLADLSSLADTVQKLGAAVNLGAVTEDQVQALIAPVVERMVQKSEPPADTKA